MTQYRHGKILRQNPDSLILPIDRLMLLHPQLFLPLKVPQMWVPPYLSVLNVSSVIAYCGISIQDFQCIVPMTSNLFAAR